MAAPERGRLPISGPRRTSTQSSRHRAARACDSCRQRKTKCDGTRPTCEKCQVFNVACVYSDVKRVRDKQKLESAELRVEVYENLLRDISHDVERHVAKRIANVLRDPYNYGRLSRSRSNSRSSSIGSLNEVDVVGEDLNRNADTRATGYMGKTSEVAWMQRLGLETARLEDARESQAQPEAYRGLPSSTVAEGLSISAASYYLDNLNLSDLVNENPFDLPPKELADEFLDVYLQSVNVSFPIIRKPLFVSQYEKFFNGIAPTPGKKWLSILNLVFAIGALYCQLSQPDYQKSFDHRTFLSRARDLAAGDSIAYDNPDLQQVQIEALLAFYLFGSSQINRAWKMIGIAVRSSVALGLNLRSNYDGMQTSSIEARSRLWWAIFSLEHLLSVSTSRASCIGQGSYSTNPPLPVIESQYDMPEIRLLFTDKRMRENNLNWTLYQTPKQRENRRKWLSTLAPIPVLYFFYAIDLSMITHTFVNRVYSSDVVRDGWAQIEGRIRLYHDRLNDWLHGLHPSFAFTGDKCHVVDSMTAYRVNLALNFYSARIILGRPCLTRVTNVDEPGIQFSRSRFGHNTAVGCLRASLSMISIFPNQPNTAWVYKISPWWSALHFLMQATVILLIHMSIGPVPVGTEKEPEWPSEDNLGAAEAPASILAACKKAIGWLNCLGQTDQASWRAFELCVSLLRRIAPSKGLDVSDVPSIREEGSMRPDNEDLAGRISQNWLGQPQDLLSPDDAFHPATFPADLDMVLPMSPQVGNEVNEFLDSWALSEQLPAEIDTEW